MSMLSFSEAVNSRLERSYMPNIRLYRITHVIKTEGVEGQGINATYYFGVQSYLFWQVLNHGIQTAQNDKKFRISGKARKEQFFRKMSYPS